MSLTGKDSESLETEWMRKTKTCSVNVAYGSGLSISVFCLEQRINGRCQSFFESFLARSFL